MDHNNEPTDDDDAEHQLLTLPEDLRAAVVRLVQKGKTSPEEIIQTPQIEIERIGGMNHVDSSKLLFHVSQIIFRAKPTTVLQKIQEPHEQTRLPLGCTNLNQLLRGGFPMQGIIEIVGEASAGKTQIVLQTLLQAILPTKYGGLGASGLYLCSEDLPSARWGQLVDTSCDKYFDLSPKELNDRLFLVKLHTVEKLQEIIKTSVKPLIRTKNIKVIVIDSIAALFRVEYSAGQAAERAAMLYHVTKTLKELSCTFKIPILCVNQVTDSFSEKYMIKTTNQVIPALGLAWANNVDMRIMLSKTKQLWSNATDSFNDDHLATESEEPLKKKRKLNTDAAVVREFKLVFAPHLPPCQGYFVIDAYGVHGIKMD